MVMVGYLSGVDPAVRLGRDGVIGRHVEKERQLGLKHAPARTELIRKVAIPHAPGRFYAGIAEYLDADGGESDLIRFAARSRPRPRWREILAQTAPVAAFCRTFCSSGPDAPAAGRCPIEQPRKPPFRTPENLIRQ